LLSQYRRYLSPRKLFEVETQMPASLRLPIQKIPKESKNAGILLLFV
jgi:hypothetical protein